MKLLVTGGAGYVGSVVAATLIEAGHQVAVLDDLSGGHLDAVPPEATLFQARIHDAADVITPQAGFDGVLHFAAFIAAGESVLHPEKYWENNTIGSLRLLTAVRDAGVPRFVFSSTAMVYGDPATMPIDETAPLAPPNPYAGSKLAVDHALSGYAAAHGLAAVSLRYFNAAGAYGRYGERHTPETHLIPMALQVAAGQREKLQLFGDDYPTRDGTCVRDYVHVADLAMAHLLALDAANAGEHRVYNLGTGIGSSNREVIETVQEVTGRFIPVEICARRPGDTIEMVAGNTKARTELGWTLNRADLRIAVADAWNFYRS